MSGFSSTSGYVKDFSLEPISLYSRELSTGAWAARFVSVYRMLFEIVLNSSQNSGTHFVCVIDDEIH